MPPDSRLAVVATVQQAITVLLTTREPEFLRLGHALFVSFAVIVLAWEGIQMMFTSQGLNDKMLDFVKLLVFVSFGYAMTTFYETPIPGFGVSFSNLITDQTAYLANVLDARSMENTYAHLDTLWTAFVTPDAWSILANLVYVLLWIVVMAAKVASLGVVAYGLIASAVCGLLGPLFVPFFIVPKLDFLFWGWFKAFLQYSFMPVVALAYLMVGEQFIRAYVTTVPAIVTEDLYLIYAAQAMVVVATFATGIMFVPSLTNSIFSGYSHGGNGIGLLAVSRGLAASRQRVGR